MDKVTTRVVDLLLFGIGGIISFFGSRYLWAFVNHWVGYVLSILPEVHWTPIVFGFVVVFITITIYLLGPIAYRLCHSWSNRHERMSKVIPVLIMGFLLGAVFLHFHIMPITDGVGSVFGLRTKYILFIGLWTIVYFVAQDIVFGDPEIQEGETENDKE